MYPKTEKYMQQLIDQQDIPGISYAFIAKNKIEQKTIGFKELVPDKIPLTNNTLYDMASLTKVICTTTIILQLVEDNRIDLESPLHLYLPEFTDEEVTIRELLTHTSDIDGYIPNRNELAQNELKQAILQLTSGEKRGKIVKYTDTGTILLGFLIEKIYEKSVHSVFMEEVLRPLAMSGSGFSNFDLKNVAPTELTSSRGMIKGSIHDPKAFVLKEHCGSAGLFSTSSDTVHFAQMILNKGVYKSETILKEATVISLLKDHAKSANKPRSLGWDLIRYDNRNLLYHTGYTGTFMIIDIEAQEAFIFLSNRVHPVDNRDEYLKLRDELIRIYLKERQELEKML